MRAESARHLLRVVVDTNVWISSALSASGAPALVARQVLETRRPVFSEATFAELESRLWRPKFDRYLGIELRQRILHDLGAVADWVEIPSDLAQQTWSRDPDDDHFIRAALAAHAPLLVTGDADLLDLSAIVGFRILTPADALREWDGAPAK
ncbi:putative toxin-antitoxin system toxin component, PIN family [Xanthomonadaceae bacterium XH05]|nr:putative toxin-antitoxin system toxin component, PIN family [Xanthomonadaceae bacterium XH05]